MKRTSQRDFLWHNKILRQIYHGSDREPKVIYQDILWTTESVPQYIDLRVNNSSPSKPKLKRYLAINTKPHHQILLRYWLNQNWRKHKIKTDLVDLWGSNQNLGKTATWGGKGLSYETQLLNNNIIFFTFWNCVYTQKILFMIFFN